MPISSVAEWEANRTLSWMLRCWVPQQPWILIHQCENPSQHLTDLPRSLMVYHEALFQRTSDLLGLILRCGHIRTESKSPGILFFIITVYKVGQGS